MLGILIDGAVLVFLLKIINDEDIDFTTAVLVALATAVGTTLLAFGLGSVMGPVGGVLAAILAAAGLGLAVSALFGAEIKRSFLIAVAFMVVHIAVGFGMRAMLG